MDEYEDLLDNGESKLSPEMQEMLDSIEADAELNSEIAALIGSLDAGTLDLAMLQSKFLLLIKAALGRLKNGKSKVLEHKLRENEKEMLDQLAGISQYLMMQRTPLAQEASKGIQNPKDQYSNLTATAAKNTQQILKRFAVYEIYKVMNPHRIAGETKKENFVNNFVTGGIRKAMRYDAKELQKASPQEIKQLNKAHSKFTKSGGRGI